MDNFSNIESSEEDIDTIFQAELDKIRNGKEIVNENNSNKKNGDLVFNHSEVRPYLSVLNSFIEWPVSMYRWTYQYISEELGLDSEQTHIDDNLIQEITALKTLRKECYKMCGILKKLSKSIENMSKYENIIALEFNQLSITDSNILSHYYEKNSEVLSSAHNNSNILINSLNFFHSSIITFCTQTIRDALWTMNQIKNIRFLYDGQRRQCNKLEISKSCDNISKLSCIKDEMNKSKLKYDKLNEDLKVKLKLLQDNKTNLFKNQLENLNQAIKSFYSSKLGGYIDTLQGNYQFSQKYFITMEYFN